MKIKYKNNLIRKYYVDYNKGQSLHPLYLIFSCLTITLNIKLSLLPENENDGIFIAQ